MKQIGKGWEYRVYDVGSGRVRKVHLSPVDQFLRALFSKYSTTRFQPLRSFSKTRRISSMTKNSLETLRNAADSSLAPLLGHPRFLTGADYEQDFTPTVGSYFPSHTLDENKVVVSRYIELIMKLWDYGFSDDVFNFSINNGIDKNGLVVQLDLGELVFKREDVETSIRQKKWLGQFSFTSLADRTLANFYRNEMDRLITLETLRERWGCKAR